MAKRRNRAVQALEGTTALSEVQTVVKRLAEDDGLRDDVGRAIESSRRVYDRVGSVKKPGKLLEDKKLQGDAVEALDAVRSVVIAFTGLGKSLPSPKAMVKQKKKKRRRFGRLLMVSVVGGAIALVASESVRSKVLDALFGAEEEFQYSPPAPTNEADAPGTPLSAV